MKTEAGREPESVSQLAKLTGAAAAADFAAPVLLEASWEADDIKAECARLGLVCNELSQELLAGLPPAEFVRSTFCCNTAVVQAQLRAAGASSGVPDTYPDELAAFLHRRVKLGTLGDVDAHELPLFVKPQTNDKAFDGVVVHDTAQLQRIRAEVAAEAGPACVDAVAVFTADVVVFTVEYRLFIGRGRLYGSGIRDGDATLPPPPAAFVNSVVAASGDKFWAVDVGLMDGVGGTDTRWALVEVNPPFALDDCGLHIEPYMQYCIDACAWLRGEASRARKSVVTPALALTTPSTGK
jgi:hypothetical protein